MAQLTRVTGVRSAIANLRKSKKITAEGVEIGLITAGHYIQRESQLIVPVRFGILKNSAFTRALGAGFLTIVKVGYTAIYAIFVHENLEARHKPGKKAKFLESVVKKKRLNILAIVQGLIVRKVKRKRFIITKGFHRGIRG